MDSLDRSVLLLVYRFRSGYPDGAAHVPARCHRQQSNTPPTIANVAAIALECSSLPTYGGTTLIALIATVSVTAVANVVCALATRDINNGTIVIVAKASALIHIALARGPRPACVASVATPLTSNTQAVPLTLATSPPVWFLRLAIGRRAASPMLAGSRRAASAAIAARAHAASAMRTAAGRARRGAGSVLAAAMIRGLAVFNAVLVTLGR